MKRSLALIGTVFTLSATGCATVATPPCAPDQQRQVSELLYFGTAMPGGVVSADAWSDFLGTSVTPRFPNGLSAWQAAGQWLSADGTLVHEGSYVLNLVHAGDDTADRDVRALMTDYKTRFQQEAVMRVKSGVCVSF